MPDRVYILPDVSTLTPTITLASLASQAARQAAKLDLGAQLAEFYVAELRVTFAAAPTDAGNVEVRLGFSSEAAAANGNPAGLTGADAAYTGGGSAIAVGKQQATFIDFMPVRNSVGEQVFKSRIFQAQARYVCALVINDTDTAFSGAAHSLEIRAQERQLDTI